MEVQDFLGEMSAVKPTTAVWACLSLQLEMAGGSSLLVRNNQGRMPLTTTLPVLEFSGGQPVSSLSLVRHPVPTDPKAPSLVLCLILSDWCTQGEPVLKSF